MGEDVQEGPAMASGDAKLTPMAKMPMCSMDEYASKRFRSRWEAKYNAPSKSVSTPKPASTSRAKAAPAARSVIW